MADLFSNIGDYLVHGTKRYQETQKTRRLANVSEELHQIKQQIEMAGGLGTPAGVTIRNKWLREKHPEMWKAVGPELARLQGGADTAKRPWWMEGAPEGAAEKYRGKMIAGKEDILREIDRWSAIRQKAVDTWGKVRDQQTYDIATKRIRELTKQASARKEPSRGWSSALGQGQVIAPEAEGGALDQLGPDVYERFGEDYRPPAPHLNVRTGRPRKVFDIRGGLVGERTRAGGISPAKAQKGVTIAEAPSAADYKPATLTEGQIMSQIAKMKVDGRIIGYKRSSEVVRDYPKLSGYLVKMSPAEKRAILQAINDGMPEADILRFFTFE